MSDKDRFFMKLALAEAKKGLGHTSPNPCVGAVIVKEGRIVGRGYHRKAGTPHAEIHALADAGTTAAKGATMYVTLEPCNHTGRTPPCSHAILDAGISKVVIGLMDPNPLAEGGGKYLRNNNISVVKGICEQECRQINYPFLKHVTTGLPWVIMKAGMSLNGKITYQKGVGGAITGTETGQFVHKLRNQFDAILIGGDTVRIDDPSLTTRLPGQETRDPQRVIVDSRLRIDPEATILQQQSKARTRIFCISKASEKKEAILRRAGARVHRVSATDKGQVDLTEVLQTLSANNITSLLVEGGAAIHGSFLSQGLIDEVYLFLAPFFIGNSGLSLLSGYSVIQPDQVVRLKDVTVRQVGEDCLIHGLFSGKFS